MYYHNAQSILVTADQIRVTELLLGSLHVARDAVTDLRGFAQQGPIDK